MFPLFYLWYIYFFFFFPLLSSLVNFWCRFYRSVLKEVVFFQEKYEKQAIYECFSVAGIFLILLLTFVFVRIFFFFFNLKKKQTNKKNQCLYEVFNSSWTISPSFITVSKAEPWWMSRGNIWLWNRSRLHHHIFCPGELLLKQTILPLVGPWCNWCCIWNTCRH